MIEAPQPRPAAAAREGQEHQAVRLQSAGQPVRLPLQHAVQAVRQSQDPPRRDRSRSARRTSSRPRSAIRSTTRSARRCSSAARRWPATTGMEDVLNQNAAKAKRAAEGGGLRRHADRADAVDRPAGADQPRRRSPRRSSRRAGFKVDMQSMDWQTLVARRTKKDPPDKGGWNAFLTSWVAADILNPVMAGFFNASCDKAMFGWPCDETIEKMRDAVRQGDRSGQAEADRRRPAEVLGRPSDPRQSRPVVLSRSRCAPTSTA